MPTDLQVRTWVDKDPGKGGNPTYGVGENIRISVQTNQDAYVHLFSVKATGEISLILPSPFDRDNLVRGGQTRTFPPQGARYEFTVTGPEGQDRVLAVASRTPLNIDQIGDIQSGNVRVRGADNLGRALAIVVTPLPDRDWVSDVAFFQVGRGTVVQPQPQPQPTTGTLQISSNPQGAQVTVNGRVVGNTPANLAIQPGQVNVEVRLSGYETFRATANVRAGETTSINANLVQIARNGTLQVNSTPQGAQVTINGRVVGNTPGSFTVQPGRYDIEVRLSGYETFRTSVVVNAGQALQVNAPLVGLRATLEIVTNVDARIFIDGREVGQTRNGSLRVEVDAGRTQIVALAPGYRVAFIDVSASSARPQQVRLSLIRAQ